MGSKGTFRCSFTEYSMKYIIDGENPEQKLIKTSIKTPEGLPSFCGEELIIHEENGEISGDAFNIGTRDFYKMVYDAITENKPMAIKPEHAAMVISVIEQVHAENPLPVKF